MDMVVCRMRCGAGARAAPPDHRSAESIKIGGRRLPTVQTDTRRRPTGSGRDRVADGRGDAGRPIRLESVGA